MLHYTDKKLGKLADRLARDLEKAPSAVQDALGAGLGEHDWNRLLAASRRQHALKGADLARLVLDEAVRRGLTGATDEERLDALRNALGLPSPSGNLPSLITTLANMTLSGEPVEGVPYQQNPEDAADALAGLIRQARALAGLTPPAAKRAEYVLYPSAAKRLNAWLGMTEAVSDAQRDGTLETITVHFPGPSAIEADFKVVNSDSGPYLDAVLFEGGHELAVLDPAFEQIEGEYLFEDSEGGRYAVVILVDPALACAQCGHEEFRAAQKVYLSGGSNWWTTVLVNGQGYFLRNIMAEAIELERKGEIDDADQPVGPFTCAKCGHPGTSSAPLPAAAQKSPRLSTTDAQGEKIEVGHQAWRIDGTTLHGPFAVLSVSDDGARLGLEEGESPRMVPTSQVLLHKLTNSYTCSRCSEEWEDTWSCGCDDDCPECGETCSPAESEDLVPEGYRVFEGPYCKHCQADLTAEDSIVRLYLNKDGGRPGECGGHYDPAHGFFEPDGSASLPARYDLTDDSDYCAACHRSLSTEETLDEAFAAADDDSVESFEADLSRNTFPTEKQAREAMQHRIEDLSAVATPKRHAELVARFEAALSKAFPPAARQVPPTRKPLDPRELATVLAALALMQEELAQNAARIRGMDHFHDVACLSAEQIEALSARLGRAGAGQATRPTLSYPELSTVLAALRLMQELFEGGQSARVASMPQFAEVDRLSMREINDLCERLNC